MANNGISFKTISPEKLGQNLKDKARATKDEVFLKAYNWTYQLRDIARAMSPVDKGNLEGAISTKINRNQYDKATYMVYIKDIYGGVNVSDYMLYIHEHRGDLWHNLGKKSLAKQGSSEYRVGEKFMDRAFEAKEQEIIRDLEKSFFREFDL